MYNKKLGFVLIPIIIGAIIMTVFSDGKEILEKQVFSLLSQIKEEREMLKKRKPNDLDIDRLMNLGQQYYVDQEKIVKELNLMLKDKNASHKQKVIIFHFLSQNNMQTQVISILVENIDFELRERGEFVKKCLKNGIMVHRYPAREALIQSGPRCFNLMIKILSESEDETKRKHAAEVIQGVFRKGKCSHLAREFMKDRIFMEHDERRIAKLQLAYDSYFPDISEVRKQNLEKIKMEMKERAKRK